ncbi:MAG: sodium:solute symporter [bacterium]|nr:sodium:solute symporter [bacterium]
MILLASITNPGHGFKAIDWIVLAAYFAILAVSGFLFARRKSENSEDYFLGSRSMPSWAVAVSIVATSLSAVTFVGAPELAYKGNLTYLATNIGMIIAAFVIAILFIPRFYQARSASIYEFLETRFGPPARKGASITFLIGRVLASGARVYAGAIPASMVLFGIEDGSKPAYLIAAIAVLTFVGIVYTLAGGIRSVIWADVLQFAILIGAALCAIVILINAIDAPFSEVMAELRTGMGDDTSKLTVLDTSFDFASPFTLPACIIGFTVLGIGSYGTDQDLAQRMLTCKDAKHGARSVVAGILLGVPSVAVFLTLGLLLWVLYQRPHMTSIPNATKPDDSTRVFLHYILTQIPSGVRGLMMAGLFAAGLSSLNSAINAMSAAFISDLYKPWTDKASTGSSEKKLVRAGRVGVIVCGILLGGFACACIYWQSANNDTLINFALGVMGFAYAGLVGVFFCAILTKRGNSSSVLAALIVGFLWMFLTQPFMYEQLAMLQSDRIASFYAIHFSWKLTIGAILAFAVCSLGSRQDTASRAAPEAA